MLQNSHVCAKPGCGYGRHHSGSAAADYDNLIQSDTFFHTNFLQAADKLPFVRYFSIRKIKIQPGILQLTNLENVNEV